MLAIHAVDEICSDYEYWQLQREMNLLQLDEDVLYRPFQTLSNGEQTKLMLAVLFLKENNFLLIDEPTNHLDMESITALNNGVIKFKGVILFSCHDHQFVQTTANRIIEILPNGKMIDKITTYDEYLASDDMARKRTVYTAQKEDDEN
jgi:ATPase subunit of ABC transporter with duplicated ATPase domains